MTLKVVVQEDVNGHFVSTVWLGLDHGNGIGPPLIFETMIFSQHEGECTVEDEQWRYPTEADALAGHERAKEIAGRCKQS